jgi:ABC-type Fe3+ transport system permease subunit
MTNRHLNRWHHDDWKHIIDYETFWILTFSGVVLGTGLLALFSISPNNAITLP